MGEIDDLERLKQLKDDGTITEEEFNNQKEKILNGTSKNAINNDSKSTKAMTGFVLGLISIIAWIIPLIGYPITILGIIFSALGLNSKNKGKAIAGLILSIIFLILTFINSALGAILTTALYY